MTQKRITNKFAPVCAFGLLLFTGCATGMHGNFVSHSYIDPNIEGEGKLLGPVIGTSSQTLFLYVFPMGDPPSTHQAVSNAKNKISGTRYLSDMSFDDREDWGVGYKKKVIEVSADARD